jgi:DNA-binding transcriptional MerR regulator
MAIDTLKVAKRLREVGFTEPQAEAVVAAVREGAEGADLATRADIAELRAELKADIREAELRLEAKIEAIKADILNRVFGLILGTLVVNIVAVVGAMFAVAKLVGH